MPNKGYLVQKSEKSVSTELMRDSFMEAGFRIDLKEWEEFR